MRVLKAIAISAAALVLLAQSAGAQRTANFDDSWFWGFKGGANTFSTGANGTTSVPTWGFDWLITRTHGGLYVSAEQSFFHRALTETDAASVTGKRQVEVKNLNRVGFALVAFPDHFGIFTPYGGVGAEIALFGTTKARADSLGAAPDSRFLAETEKARSRSSLLVMAGIQTQSSRLGLFVQNTFLPSASNFLVKSSMNVFEVGVRHSFGSPAEDAH